ncbi:MAG: flavin reductase [Actinomycetota bacterium]|nr:flavin reductase [Actinomycetota bacterium]
MSETPVALDCTVPIWDRFYLVHPLVIIGTVEPDGAIDLAPKHMAGPVSWENHFGFVCCDTHATYRNAVRSRVFTVSYPTPDQLVETSLTAAPRSPDNTKPSLGAVPTVPATLVEGALVRDARIHLECELERIVDDLGANSLIIGRVVAAAVAEQALRIMDREDEHVIADAPVLAYLQPNRFCVIDESMSFPFHAGWSR